MSVKAFQQFNFAENIIYPERTNQNKLFWRFILQQSNLGKYFSKSATINLLYIKNKISFPVFILSVCFLNAISLKSVVGKSDEQTK